MYNINHFLLLMILILIVSEASGTEEEGVPDMEGISTMLQKAQSLASLDFKASFEVIVYDTRPYPEAPSTEEPAVEFWSKIDYVVVGNRLRINRRYDFAENRRKQIEFPKHLHVNVWSDGGWYQFFPEEDQSVSIYAKPIPTDLNGRGFLFNLMEDRFPSYLTLYELLTAGNKVESRRLAGKCVSVQFNQSDDTSVSHRFLLSDESIPRILSYTIVLDDPEAHAVYEFEYTVQEWKTIGNIRIPWVAHLDAISPVPANIASFPGQREMKRTIYRRTDFQLIDKQEIDQKLFQVEMTPGTSIYDNRLKLSFEIGQNYLYLDGVMYETPEPIMEHPGDNLGNIIRSSTPAVRSDGAPTNNSLPPDAQSGTKGITEMKSQRPNFTRSPFIIPIAAGGLTLTLGVWWVRRTNRG